MSIETSCHALKFLATKRPLHSLMLISWPLALQRRNYTEKFATLSTRGVQRLVFLPESSRSHQHI